MATNIPEFYVVCDASDENFEVCQDFAEAANLAQDWAEETPDLDVYILKPVRKYSCSRPLVESEDLDELE